MFAASLVRAAALFLGPLALTANTVSPQEFPIRMNCGGMAAVAPSGAVFASDAPYAPGGGEPAGGFEGGTIVGALTGPGLNPFFNGPLDDPSLSVHTTARSRWDAYRFDVPNGDWIVRLHFAEVDPSVQGPSLRVFDVELEDQLILDDLDITREIGLTQYAGERTFVATVTDGVLDIVRPEGGGTSLLSALEIWPLPMDPAAPDVPTGFVAKGGFGRNILNWDPNVAPTLAGVRVYRSSEPDTGYAPVDTTWTAPARFHDDTAPVGVASFYRIAAVDVFGSESALSPVATATPQTSDASLSRVYEIEVSPDNLAILDSKVHSDPKFEVPATFRYDGRTWNAEVRYRGAGSRDAPKKSWKVKFSKSDRFEGRLDINLKAHPIDLSLIREPVAGTVFEDAGHALYQQRRVHLVVNGVFRGIFSEVERVDEFYLQSRGRDADVNIYRARSNLSLQASVEDYEQLYEKKSNESGDWSDLISFIGFLNDPETDAVDIAERFDVDGYLAYAASLGVVNYSQQPATNYFLLHDTDVDRWEVLSWDNDRGFVNPTKDLYSDEPSCSVCGMSVLMDKLLSYPPFHWRYVEKVKELLEGSGSPAALSASVAQHHSAIDADARADVYKVGWEIDELFELGVPTLSAFAVERASFLADLIPTIQAPTPPTQVWINEFIARNDKGAVDETGAHEDWIELYNSSFSALDVGRYYLTDDLARPTQWQIPPNTTIPARGHLLVWADSDVAQGPLHASFKLDADGEEIGLFDRDGASLLDVIHFANQTSDVAYGRRSDGAALFGRLAPSPGAANDPSANVRPSIEWLQHSPAFPAPHDAIEIACTLWDDEPLSAPIAFWRAGGEFSAMPMLPAGWNRFAATIPPQPAGTLVEYYVQATDGAGATVVAPPGSPMPPVGLPSLSVSDGAIGELRINEIVASNASIAADETGAFEDYIEVYNASSIALDAGGLFLTDDLSNSHKWMIPEGSVIAPHAPLLVWADGDPGDGPLHATFKLDKSGESVGLFDRDENGNGLLDAVAFGPQSTDIALGSLPDGAESRFLLSAPSPAEPNAPAPGVSAHFDSPLYPSSFELSSDGAFKLGTNAAFSVQGVAPRSAGLLLFSTGTVHLPLQGVGLSGALLVLPAQGATIPLSADGNGNSSLALSLPISTAFAGLTIYAQAIFGAELSAGSAFTLAH